MSRAADKPVRAFVQLCAAIRNDPRSIEAIALASGVDRNTIWLWVEGRTTNPNIAQLDKVARAMRFKLELTPSSPMKAKATPPIAWRRRAPPGTYPEFAAALTRLLAEQNKTQKDLAFSIWKTTNSDGRAKGSENVSCWCSGRVTPSTGYLKKIADALGVEVSTLIPPAIVPGRLKPEPLKEPIKLTGLKRPPGTPLAEWKKIYHRLYMRKSRLLEKA